MLDLDNPKSRNAVDEIVVATQLPIGVVVGMLENFDKYPRFYHSSDHILDLTDRIIKGNHEEDEERLLIITALFHDYVYDPKSQYNERQSAEQFKAWSKDLKLTGYSSVKDNTDLIYNTILDTKGHIPRTDFSEMFCYYDLAGFGEDFDTILANEQNIKKEYAWVDWTDYVKGKLEFLNRYSQLSIVKQNSNILKGITALKKYYQGEVPAPNIGIYAGSFFPFHIGHKNILEKAEKIFDKVIVATGINTTKDTVQESYLSKLEYLKYHQVDRYDTSLVEYFNSKQYSPTLIRGLRGASDLQTEIVQLRWLQELKPDIKVVNIVCDKEFDHISSSGIRAVNNFPDLDAVAERYRVK